jgi:hypothetical protein
MTTLFAMFGMPGERPRSLFEQVIDTWNMRALGRHVMGLSHIRTQAPRSALDPFYNTSEYDRDRCVNLAILGTIALVA